MRSELERRITIGPVLHGVHLSVDWKRRRTSRVRRLTDHELKVNQAIARRHGWSGDPIKHYAQCRRAEFEAGLMN